MFDDDFASDVCEFDTLAEYKEYVKNNLEENKVKEAKENKEREAVEAVVDLSEMDIPEAMIETQQRQMVDEFAQRITMQGLSMEQYFQFTGTNYQQMIENVKPQAEKRIQSRLVLEAIAAAENIVVSDEEFDKEIETMAEVYQMDASKVKEMLGEKEMKNIRQDLAVRKAAEFVAENAKEK